MMKNNPLPRLDENEDIREQILPHCRLALGDVWKDPQGRHRVACLDAADDAHASELHQGELARLAIHDPPYNLIAFEERDLSDFMSWCERWVQNSAKQLEENAAFYVWLGADQRNNFQPLPDFMVMMRGITELKTRSFMTMRNQRGYGTQKNWMAVRQELLYYAKGCPDFNVQYTDIPKILRGYYKEVAGKLTENGERSRSKNIRPGNVWVDIQQVFYRMEENVSGCYAQKPLKCIDRIIRASSNKGDVVADYFSHSGTTLLASEQLGRRCFTMDIDPIFCEITIRRLELFRETGRLGWQNAHPFEDIISHEVTTKECKASADAQQTLF